MNKLKVFKILCPIYFRLGWNEVHSVVVKIGPFLGDTGGNHTVPS